LAVHVALDDLERRLDSLEQKVNEALEQSRSLLEYLRTRPPTLAREQVVTRRIVLEETVRVPIRDLD